MNETLVSRLRKRSEIRRQIKTRKSVQEGKPDRIADLLEEAALHIESLENMNKISETARYLASYLIEHWSEFFNESDWHEGMLQRCLEGAIQEFYDTLP